MFAIAKYVSALKLLYMQAELPNDRKLQYWYQSLEPDHNDVTKLGCASTEGAQSAALAIDSFHPSGGTAGHAQTGNATDSPTLGVETFLLFRQQPVLAWGKRLHLRLNFVNSVALPVGTLP